MSDDDDAVEFCTMQTLQPQSRFANSSVDFDYVLDDDSVCSPKLKDLKLVKFVVDRYLIFYGCTNLGDEYEEGSWVLGSNSKRSESLQLLNEAFSFLKNSSSRLEDFNIYNISRAANLTALDVSSLPCCTLSLYLQLNIFFSRFSAVATTKSLILVTTSRAARLKAKAGLTITTTTTRITDPNKFFSTYEIFSFIHFSCLLACLTLILFILPMVKKR